MSYKKGPRKIGQNAVIDQTLHVIPEPAPNTATVLISKVAPVFVGDGRTNLRCGGCRTVLAERIQMGQIRRLVIKCPDCGSFNAVP